MERRSDASGGTALSSPWPVLVAVGLAVSELGVFVGSVPFSVAGLVLFGGAAAGLAHEAGYGGSPAGPLLVAGGLLVVVGGGVWATRLHAFTVPALLAAPAVDGVARRGVATLVAGGLLAGTGLVEWSSSTLSR